MSPELRLPTGWIKGGASPARYEMGVAARGSPALIRSRSTRVKTNDFGTLMQSIAADYYRGKRLRLRAELKTERVTEAGTIWMRIDGRERRAVRFDNMENRTEHGVLKQTVDWTVREIVLDVPADAESIHFGFYLRGAGRAWARRFEVTEVGDDVAVTAQPKPYPNHPVNLGFGDLEDAA
jgi:hypothetical protein